MHSGRSRQHFLSRKVHRNQINRCLAHPQDDWDYEDLNDYNLANLEEDDFCAKCMSTPCTCHICGGCGEPMDDCCCYDDYYDDWYDDGWYDQSYEADPAPKGPSNLTRPGAGWDL